MKRILLSSLLLFATLISSNSKTRQELVEAYVAKYSAIAVSQMQSKGIPASITLAQGLFESGFGESYLAKQANNHFGIKCGSDWTGGRILYDDDKKGECFRMYPDAESSYRDHSDFLRFKERYASLFELEITDYKSWAHGLKKAGYATNPLYAQKLIALIEEFDLGRFDSVSGGSDSLAVPLPPRVLESPEKCESQGRKGIYSLSLGREVLKMNGIPFIYARGGETYSSIAKVYDMFPSELMRYNDVSVDRELSAGEMVYFHTKARQAAKGLDKHICQDGDTMLSVAQKYGIRLKALMRLNAIKSPDHVLREDDTLVLRRK